MPARQTLIPAVWLISDARSDAVLERVLRRLPRGSGLIFRHYHLGEAERRSRFQELARVARARGHVVVVSGDARKALRWGADGAYGPAQSLSRGPACLRLATAHSLRGLTKSCRADAILLSPVYPTRSHPGSKALGSLRFRLISRRSAVPVIALGGMTPARAMALGSPSWAAIDGLSG
ncbi:MAG: thiamine phosphate synthase [Novosphingobium sp.]